MSSEQFVLGLGRWPYEPCPASGCRLRHRPGTPCPSRDRREPFSKWRNSAGFAKGAFLYNYASARRADSPFVLLVEGACGAWRALEADVPAVAVMGVELTRTQAEKLGRLGKMVRVAFDNDDAGERGLSGAADQLSKFGVWWEPVKVPTKYHPTKYHDVGEMPPSEVARWLGTRASPRPV